MWYAIHRGKQLLGDCDGFGRFIQRINYDELGGCLRIAQLVENRFCFGLDVQRSREPRLYVLEAQALGMECKIDMGKVSMIGVGVLTE